jgi:hypothetical protein
MKDEDFQVPAIIFERPARGPHRPRCSSPSIAKHTRLNASHLVSLSGRQLYRDDALAAAHDVVRALNDKEDSPLNGEIKLLGVGRGRGRAGAARSGTEKLFASDAFGGPRQILLISATTRRRFFVNYFKQVSVVFGAAWKRPEVQHQVRRRPARVYRVAPDVVQRLDQAHADRSDFRAIGRVIAPWGRRIGDLRFESEGAWKRQGTTVESLARELKLALEYPEGAG